MDSRRYKRRKRREYKRNLKKQLFRSLFKTSQTLSDYDKIYTSAVLCKDGVRWKASTQKFLYDILLNCYDIKSDVINNKNIHKGFVVFYLLERGKPREAYSIHIGERALQRTLSDYILMPFIKNSIVDRNCASIKGKGEIYAENALKKDLQEYWKLFHNNDGYAIFLDVSKYFFNINRKDILQRLSNVGDVTIQRIIKQFSDAYNVYEHFKDDVGYGLGTQFVQAAGIFALSPIDHYIKECEKLGYLSTRYMDDTYILCEKDDKDWMLEKYIKKCELMGFPMNLKKCVAVPVNKPFVWLKKLYCLTDTGKVIVRIGYKAVTRERHAIVSRMNWVNDNRMSFYSYSNQVRSWLINIRKHYQSSAPCLVIERTFQFCFFRLLEKNKALYIQRLNTLISGLKTASIIVLIHIATLYCAFEDDAIVLSTIFNKKQHRQMFYVNECKIKDVITRLENSCVNYVVVKSNIRDEISTIYRVSSFNSYRYILNGHS